MFYHWTNFSHFLTEDLAKLTAKVANEIIDKQGKLVYGVETQDGNCQDLSTDKTKDDTHVGIVLGLELMGNLKPSKSPIKIDRPTDDDYTRTLKDQNDNLKRLLKQSREVSL